MKGRSGRKGEWNGRKGEFDYFIYIFGGFCANPFAYCDQIWRERVTHGIRFLAKIHIDQYILFLPDTLLNSKVCECHFAANTDITTTIKCFSYSTLAATNVVAAIFCFSYNKML